MGTNYYMFKKEKPDTVDASEGLHIGKYSCGWVFAFQAYPSKALTTYHQWKQCTKYMYIYDEYGRFVSYKDFWDMVEESKETTDGNPPYSFDNLPEGDEERIDGKSEYMCNGFMFITGDFS